MDKTKSKPKGKATPVKGKSPASQYVAPNVYSVATEITAEDDGFLPVNRANSNVADVFVMVRSLNHLNEQSVRLVHRNTEVFDCGFKIKLPAGFRVRADINPEWARRGLVLSSAYVEEGGLKLVVINVGHETPLVIPHKANIAHIWAEPAYTFDWKM